MNHNYTSEQKAYHGDADKFVEYAGYSNPLDEQTYLVNTINRLQKMPQWNSTAVIVTYDGLVDGMIM